MATTTLQPPANDQPIADDGQHSHAWAAYHDDVATAIATLKADKGVTDGSNAAAGVVGELLQTVNGVPTAGGAGATVNAASVSLTPGDWDVRGEAWVNIAGGATSIVAALSTTTLGLPALSANTAQTVQIWAHTAGLQSLIVGPCRMSFTVTTTVYLAARTTGIGFTAYGKVEARRIR